MQLSTPPMIRANLLEPILNAIRAQGLDTATLLRCHALPQAPIDPYQLIPLGKYVALFEQAALLLSDPFLGLRLGQAFRPELLGPLGFIFQASVDLRRALQQLSSYVSVWQSETRVELITADDTADYIYQIGDTSIRPRRQDAEYSLASICSLIRNFLGDQWAPLEVHFEHAGFSSVRNVYDQAFHAPVFFGQNVNRLVIRTADLDRPGHLFGSIDDALHGTSSARSGSGEQGTGEFRPPGQLSDRPAPGVRPLESAVGGPGTRAFRSLFSAPFGRGAYQLSQPGPPPAPHAGRISHEGPLRYGNRRGPHRRLRRDCGALASLQGLDRRLSSRFRPKGAPCDRWQSVRSPALTAY